jgi:hypothetical protein
MKLPRASLVAFLFLEILPGHIALARATSAVSEPDVSIPFELRHNFLIVVKGRIGSLEDLKFIVDTGSSKTVVSESIAAQLKLPRQPATTVVVRKRLRLQYSVFPDVQIGSLKAVRRQLLVADLQKVSEFGAHVDAILGLDLLSRCKVLEIDYAVREIYFLKPCAASDDVRTSVNSFFVLATLEGRPIHLQIDTGMQGVFLFEERLRAHVKSWESTDRVAAFMGSSRIEQVRLPSLWLGSVQMTAPRIRQAR